ncbi:hypothetical protein RFI_11424 [Reticulomyxa filosa]|uniref:Uncharacterized protein n=1 Tax=Reticulomyxa filosa TaxID=46433 RepID=X6NII1_RETFI|nr:hypothetical protein RFI_11424 [Reticulomyxa filosa]|eukprot:ETO25713.1 hypothetical protein RFI_11424 [Reticulomyxa filosa]
MSIRQHIMTANMVRSNLLNGDEPNSMVPATQSLSTHSQVSQGCSTRDRNISNESRQAPYQELEQMTMGQLTQSESAYTSLGDRSGQYYATFDLPSLQPVNSIIIDRVNKDKSSSSSSHPNDKWMISDWNSLFFAYHHQTSICVCIFVYNAETSIYFYKKKGNNLYRHVIISLIGIIMIAGTFVIEFEYIPCYCLLFTRFNDYCNLLLFLLFLIHLISLSKYSNVHWVECYKYLFVTLYCNSIVAFGMGVTWAIFNHGLSHPQLLFIDCLKTSNHQNEKDKWCSEQSQNTFVIVTVIISYCLPFFYSLYFLIGCLPVPIFKNMKMGMFVVFMNLICYLSWNFVGFGVNNQWSYDFFQEIWSPSQSEQKELSSWHQKQRWIFVIIFVIAAILVIEAVYLFLFCLNDKIYHCGKYITKCQCYYEYCRPRDPKKLQISATRCSFFSKCCCPKTASPFESNMSYFAKRHKPSVSYQVDEKIKELVTMPGGD